MLMQMLEIPNYNKYCSKQQWPACILHKHMHAHSLYLFLKV